MTPQIIPTPVDTTALYNQIRDEYSQAMGLEHGLSKDSVQNSFGHRENPNGNGWGYEIKLIENKKEKFVTITDWGTSGLIGDLYNNINDVPDELRNDPNQKLARFEKLLNTGINLQNAAGSLGRGNTTYQLNSQENKMMWDSLRSSDGKYVANHRFIDENIMNQYNSPFLDAEAHNFIQEQAGLLPIEKPGLRITIFSPSEGLVEAIKNGNYKKDLEDTWFEILGKLGGNIDGIFINVNGETKKAGLPEHWEKYFNNEYPDERVYRVENINITFPYSNPVEDIPSQRVTARAAQMVYFLTDGDLDENQRGIVVNRKYMPVNQLNPILGDLELPADCRKRVCGYVKLDHSSVTPIGKSYEEMIKRAEDKVHYRLSSRLAVYGNLKSAVIDNAEEFKQRAGIRQRGSVHIERERRMSASRAASNINKYLIDFGVGGINPQPPSSNFIIALNTIDYPGNSAEIYIDQTVENISFKIKNRTPNNQNTKLTIEILDQNKDRMELIGTEELNLSAHTNTVSQSYSVNLNRDTYATCNHTKIYLRAILKNENERQLKAKLIPWFLGISPDNDAIKPELFFERLELPNSNTRVDIGDRIENINLLVKNETNFDWDLKLKIAIHDVENETDVSVLINWEQFILAPGTELSFPAEDIIFDDENFGHIDEGQLKIKGFLVSSIDQNDHEKGEKLSIINQSLWLNMDPPGVGLFDIKFEEMLSTSSRCRVQGINGRRTLWVNTAHPSFIILQNEPNRSNKEEDYYFNLGLIEGLRYCFINGYGSAFNVDPSADLASSEVLKEIFNAIDTGLGKHYGSM